MKILLTIALSLALTAASYAADDGDNDLHLHIQKGHYVEAVDTRAFGDLKYNPPFVLREGHVRVPIVLLDFPDRKFTFSQEQLYDLYMGQHPVEERPVRASATAGCGYGSAQEFFFENSFGRLDFEFDFYGPYTLPHTHEYYGENTGRTLARVLDDAFPLIDDDINFVKFDNDGDSICEIVYFLYAGEGAQFSDNKDDIWATCGINTNKHTTKDGIILNRIGVNNELLLPEGNEDLEDGRALINGIGVFCHELSHGLGLPDLYYTSDSWPDWDNNGPEDWDLMDSGFAVRYGFWPMPFSAWERMIMGWMEAEELRTEQDVTVWPLNDEAGRGKAYVVRNPANRDEFWTIENIPGNGWYRGMYGGGKGIIIMHVDYSDENFGVFQKPNSVYGKPRCTILPADGRIISSYYLYNKHPDGTEITLPIYSDNLRGDPYPGSTGITSLAAYHNYTGEEDLVNTMPITGIHLNEDGSVSFHFGGDPTGIRELRPEDTDSPVYDLQGRRSGEMQRGRIYVRNGRVVTIQ